MSVLLDETSRLLIYGIAGRLGRFAARDLVDYGAEVVAGVAPGGKLEAVAGITVYGSAEQACRETAADVAVVFIPAPFALDAVLDVAEAGCRLIVYPGDGLPVRDAVEMRAAALANGATLLGPNTPGLISPGKSKAGFMPSFCYRPGPVGVVSRSGSLSYEVAHQLTRAGIGQSTALGIGGDPVKGLRADEALALLHQDAETRAVVFVGEIGGNDEYEVARYAARADAKPVTALIVGRTAPRGKKMGHAAALIGSHADTHEAKLEALAEAGADAIQSVEELLPSVRRNLAASPVAPLAQA